MKTILVAAFFLAFSALTMAQTHKKDVAKVPPPPPPAVTKRTFTKKDTSVRKPVVRFKPPVIVKDSTR